MADGFQDRQQQFRHADEVIALDRRAERNVLPFRRLLALVTHPAEHESDNPCAFRLKGSGALYDGALIGIVAEKRDGRRRPRSWADEVSGNGRHLALSRHQMRHGRALPQPFASDCAPAGIKFSPRCKSIKGLAQHSARPWIR